VLSKSFGEFSGLFWNYSQFPLSYFYLVEGSKIFSMSTKYFIWIVRVPICLWEFSWNCCDFRSIFRAFKQFLVFTGIVFALKINSKIKKNYPFPIWAEPVGPTYLRTAQPLARQAHLSPAARAATGVSMADTAKKPPPPVFLVCAPRNPRRPYLFKAKPRHRVP
jgi:hypothetical protein